MNEASMHLHSWEDWFHFFTGFLAFITSSVGLILSSPSHTPILFWFSVLAPVLIPIFMYVLLFSVIGALYATGKVLQWLRNPKANFRVIPAVQHVAYDDISDAFRRKSMFRSLRTYLYDKKRNDSDDVCFCCSICKEEVQQGEVVALLPACAHSFHNTCVVLWLGTCMTCPICRCRVDQEIPREEIVFSEY